MAMTCLAIRFPCLLLPLLVAELKNYDMLVQVRSGKRKQHSLWRSACVVHYIDCAMLHGASLADLSFLCWCKCCGKP